MIPTRHAFFYFFLTVNLAAPLASEAQLLLPPDKSSSEMNLPIERLRRGAERRNVRAILILGLRNDQESIPLFRRLVIETSPKEPFDPNNFPGFGRGTKKEEIYRQYGYASTAAKMALTRLGADDYITEFEVGLSTTNGPWRARCIQALGYIGDKRAVKYLVPLLSDDTAPSRDEFGRGYMSYSFEASEALRHILPDEWQKMIEDLRSGASSDSDFASKWKKWWQQNEAAYK